MTSRLLLQLCHEMLAQDLWQQYVGQKTVDHRSMISPVLRKPLSI
ncbi:hypothetical protein MCEMAEM21_00375 [Oxalobacteraceae bacterium]|jgi:hypothetical protein